jgi:murein DD-endopeptidase MepM/ murein hydrolase activator NlpD
VATVRRFAGSIVTACTLGCGGAGDGRDSGAQDPATSSSTATDADTGAAPSDDSSDASAAATTAADSSTSSATTSDGSTGGGTYDCDEIGYQGVCDGDTLVWCENGTIMMADCAAVGEVCAWESDRIGNNCVPGRPVGGGFGYPVGDKTTWPAGGWTVTQVLGHYLNFGNFVGGHLAQDIAAGEAQTANAPVYSVADGEVLYAGPNTSTYVNVVLIRHLADGQPICSFYGHLGSVTVAEGAIVARGDQIATVLDWNAQFGAQNSHLHYVLLSDALCSASDAAGGALVCGYDDTPGPNGIFDLDTEPAVYTSVGDPCGDHNYPDAFLSPSQFIEAHHF